MTCCTLKIYHGNLRGPPKATPQRNKALIRPHEGKPIVNSPSMRPYFLGGVPLGSYEHTWICFKVMFYFLTIVDHHEIHHHSWNFPHQTKKSQQSKHTFAPKIRKTLNKIMMSDCFVFFPHVLFFPRRSSWRSSHIFGSSALVTLPSQPM